MTVFRTISVLVLLLKAYMLPAQNDPGFSCQAVARDQSGQIMANQSLSIEFAICSGSSTGPVVYQESHSPTTTSLALAYRDFGILAVKAIQEQQEKIGEQSARIEELGQQIRDQHKRIQKLEALILNFD